MRKLLLIPLLTLLTGCVTYYYPALESQEGVYYATDDAEYVEHGYSDYSGDLVSARYYPWWSVDYFYLGSGYYDYGYSSGFSYGYPRSIHLGYRYYPYYYPSWYRDPWYYSYWYAPYHYHDSYFGFAYHNPYWHVRYRDYHHRHHDHHGDQYARRGNRYQDRWNDPNPGLNPPRDYEDRRPGRVDDPAPGAMSRRVSVAPAGSNGNRGMEIRNRDNPKQRRSRTEPVAATPVTVQREDRGTTGQRTARQPREDYSIARREPEQVRYRTGSKQRTSRTGPVATPDRVISASVQAPRASGQENRSRQPSMDSRRGSMTVRSPAQAKTGRSRVQPVQPSADRSVQAPRTVRVNPPVRHTPPQRSAPVRATPPQRSAPVQRSAPPPRSAPAQRPTAPARYGARPSPSPKVSAPRTSRNSASTSVKVQDRDRD